MKRMLGIAALFLAALLPVHSYAATTWGTDYSDLWWNPDESGWGANIAHQGDIIFMTLFVYGADGRAAWYVAPAMAIQTGSEAIVFSGTLYETSGPFFNTTFNMEAVQERPAGHASILFTAGSAAANLEYTVDGMSQSKWIKRQTFRSNDLSGNYIGATIGNATSCGSGAGVFEFSSRFAVAHSGSEIVIARSDDGVASCTYTGGYTQGGRMGGFDGTVSCADGRQGTFHAFEIEAGHLGFTARYAADFGDGCSETGHFGGMKR